MPFFLVFLQLMVTIPAFSRTIVVSLSEKVDFKTGDVINLKNSVVSVKVEHDKGTECAVPGYNCGGGYRPPRPAYKINCGDQKPCPYIIMAFPQGESSGSLSIEDEKSCEKNKPEICFSEFARQFTGDDGCMQLKSLLGRYYCLKRYENSRRPENKGLCDQLPDFIYALKWNCYYEYAVRYKDPGFCDKYSASEQSGRDRCLLKMADMLKARSFCEKISASKDHSYKEQCRDLKF